MAVAKWILVGGSGLLGLGALAFGVVGGTSLSHAGPQAPVTISPVTVRPFPVMGARTTPTEDPTDAGVAAPAPDAGVTSPTPTPTPPPTPAPTPAPKPDAGVAAPKPPPTPTPPVGDGYLNLRASDTADVFVDGKKVGGSPIEGLKVKAGTHKVRFDCYDAAGNTLPGAPKTVTVAADSEASVDFPCPAAE
ncbi:MAG: hypothetical protein SFW67_18970 [Myxococcaceae bacterium]|nr:hypothetical protein [Myxococcaceae bacterium]